MSWVPSSRAAELADPVALAIWAAQGRLRSRARTMMRNGEPDNTPEYPAIPQEFWQMVRRKTDARAFWREGLFEVYVDDEHEPRFGERWQMSEVSFHAGELSMLLGAHGPLRGTMPPSATPNDRKHEDAAHAAAVIVQMEGILPSKAFPRVMGFVANRVGSDDSVCRAIRSAYNWMYWRNGDPKSSETIPVQATTSA